MTEEIKEISKVDKQLLDKIEHILGSELSNEEYDKFYNYFNEIRKPNILINIKDVESIKDYITNLQKENQSLKNNYNDNEQAIHKIMEENEQLRTELNGYKSKNEKVVKLIRKSLIESDITGNGILDLSNLLNILQGGDEE